MQAVEAPMPSSAIVLAAGRRMAARLSPVFGRPWLPIVYAVAGNDRNVLRSTVTKQEVSQLADGRLPVLGLLPVGR